MTRAEADQVLGAEVRRLVLGRRHVLEYEGPNHRYHRLWRMVAVDVLRTIRREIERAEREDT